MFQHRHYEWLAAFLRRERNSLHYKPADDAKAGGEFLRGYSTAIDGITARLARELRSTNPGFDESRFLAACMTALKPGEKSAE